MPVEISIARWCHLDCGREDGCVLEVSSASSLYRSWRSTLVLGFIYLFLFIFLSKVYVQHPKR